MSNKTSFHIHRFDYPTRNLLAGILLGFGFIAFVDEAVFHQLLHWHHFYDLSTRDWGLVSDGIFHSFSWFSTIASSFLLADLHRIRAYWFSRWFAGVLIGAGSFNLYDGIVQHKIMRIHQIRYNVDILPYDLVWNILAASILLVGILMQVQTKRVAVAIKGKA